MFLLIFLQKRPLRENEYVYVLGLKKKGPRGKMQTRQKMFYDVSCFIRERNFYVLPIFTSDNYIFHRETAIFRTHFSC